MSRSTPLAASLVICLALALPLLGACGKSAPARFYSLGGEAGGTGKAPPGPCSSLGIGPIELPASLDRTQIVTRGEGNRMHLAEFDQWIEPVQANFTHALMDSLSGMVCAEPIVGFPWPGGIRPDRQISVQVREFAGTLGRDAALRADWSIADKDGRVLVWKSTTLREACTGNDYGSLVAAQSRLVGKLAQEIARALSGGQQ